MDHISPNPTFIPRFVEANVRAALHDTPVVLINGPRQCGKTTLVRQLTGELHTYITLDDDTALAAARSDPAGFVRGLEYAVIDEVQRAPALLRAIKKSVDENRSPGRFLLTGSADVLVLPQITESLAGRMAVISLLPFAQAEVNRNKSDFLAQAFSGRVVKVAQPIMGAQLVERVLGGGYPEMLLRTPKRRQVWARDYINAIVQRDVRDIASLDKLDQLPRLLRMFAHHSGQLTNFTQLGNQLGLDAKTIRRYTVVFEQLFLLRRVEPWFDNRIKRLIKTPKVHFFDAGLLAAILVATAEGIKKDRSIFGPILETFVFSEVLKHISWSDEIYSLYHYRDKDNDEVDIIIENEHGNLVGIEVKAAASVNAADFKGLRKLASVRQDTFKLGIVLYDGDKVIPFNDQFVAAPISCLWS
ncbi:hypothetical protein EDC26_12153 [Paralcaligenes ureilyticus]|uniref:AAA+ ATPase domain-containing protein n=1 Tax=Paralcaligenes ureilyticus TaxID=627131 RepID=A0A4R3LTK4_9BURK|nr:hypothetical protein EDC26_12153 [Paralcaligenes ureilyticus]